MKNYICEGITIEHTPAVDVASGEAILIGSVFAVATAQIPEAEKGVFSTYGVFKLPKAGVAITIGAKLFWDATAKKLTTVEEDNTEVGYAHEAAGAGEETVLIKIG